MVRGASIFVEMAAVETWDTWFRWRENGCLRDTTIDGTWRRVAHALARSDRDAAEYIGACANWRVLPDERIIATAGTSDPSWPADGLVAVVNAAVFVRDACTPRARFDAPQFAAAATLAVRLLDDASMAASATAGGASPRLRIGVIGVADALASMDEAYGSAAACAQLRELGRALAEGCLRGSVRLAVERGARARLTHEAARRATERGMSADLVEDAARHGLRYAQLTAITSQSRLARFANDVADAIEPLRQGPPDRETPASRRSPWVGTGHRFRSGATRSPATTPLQAKIAMRDALQEWIDAPIACPSAGATTTPAND